jgi:LysM repeat protein/uncharacterized protein YcbK (DUF882 family)
MRWFLLPLLLCLNAVPANTQAASGNGRPRTHVVHDGQRLASIAKRYNVSVEALCTANGLRESETIRPGQKLVIPPLTDKDGSRTRAGNPELKTSKAQGSAKAPAESPKKATLPEARTHKVESGQRLGSIAKRYGLTVDALCAANGIKRTDTLKPGQLLTLPDPKSAAVEPVPTDALLPKPAKPGRAGYVELYTYSGRWRGQAVDRKGNLSPAAVTGISRLLGATGDRPRLDQRLIRLLVKVSDAFGGRPIRVVSGYRTTSYYDDSRHRLSRAIDFSIPGVANATLRDYLRRFSNVGVGYYPNSSFVHLDVREGAAYWVDYSGPGEAPRKRPRSERQTVAQEDRSGDDDHGHSHDEPASPKIAGEARDKEDEDTRPASLLQKPSEAPSALPPLL